MPHLELATADGPMTAYVATPASTAKGGVVVVQEAFGLTTHIQSVCDLLAEHGWSAVAPALFHRVPTQVFAYDDLASVMPVMQGLTKEGIDTDLDAAFEHLSSLGIPAERTGLVGFCMGGSVALYVAATRSIGASITFYGGGIATGRFGFPSGIESGAQLRTPWLGLYGDLDQSIPVDDVERLRDVAAGTGVPTEVVRYADALHGFNCDDRPAVFHPEAAADARARMFDWFDRHLG